jgi:aldehyde:ferredoxin oxidoreductase
MIDLRLGVTGRDDVLPARLARQARPDGGSAGVIPNMDLIMAEYYETRGWDAAGIPTPDKLRQLGLQ